MGEVKKNNLVKLFLRNKPAFILMKIYSCKSHCYASRIAKDVDCTYSHTVRIIQIFEKSGLLIFEKTGRTKIIQLTKKGRKIAENLNRLISSIRND